MRSCWALLLSAALLAAFAVDDCSAQRFARSAELSGRRGLLETIATDPNNLIEEGTAGEEPQSNGEADAESAAKLAAAATEDAPAVPAVAAPPVPAEPEPESANEIKEELKNPCNEKSCGAGRICQVDEQGDPQCVCIPECPAEVDPRRKVCSNHNETWDSDCTVYQARCRCIDGLASCRKEEDRHVHIEYYGECRKMPECTNAEMNDFPRRMRDWLFNVMRDMAERSELSPHYSEMQREAETNLTRRWANAAVWKWCDLDGHPHDRTVSRHELFPIRAPLMAMEHCIAPFLDRCDSNDDHHITLQEWGTCLEIGKDDIIEKCEEAAGSGDV